MDKARRRLLRRIPTLALALMTGACYHYRGAGPGAGHGPPPHAPAHGYRHKQANGLDLIYDSGVGLYIVSGWSNHYYKAGNYYRWHKGRWESGPKLKGPWKGASKKALPPGLQKKKGKG